MTPAWLETARPTGETIVFERTGGLERALRLGFFLVRVPPDLDLAPALMLARHFNEPRGRFADGRDAYRGFREAGRSASTARTTRSSN